MWKNVWRSIFIFLCLVPLSGGKAQAQSLAPSDFLSTTLTGTLIVNWVDLVVGEQITASSIETALVTDSGESIPIQIDPALAAACGGIEALQGKRVAVDVMTASDGDGIAAVRLTVFDSVAPAYIVPGLPRGHSKWILLLCAAPDSPLLHPDPLPHYTGLLSSSKPGLSHYWSELSYGVVDLEGSEAAGWFPLPQPASYYARQDPGFPEAVSLDPNKVATDCIGAADATVDFSQYEGIAYFVPLPRSVLGDSIVYRGGFAVLAVDGIERNFRTVWFPTEVGYKPSYGQWLASAGTVAHEMGHGFSLPHSSAQYGKVYDSIWDIMSGGPCSIQSPDYYCFGAHTIGWHKDSIGWISPTRKYTLTLDSPMTLELTRLALPPENGYLLLKAPIGDGKRFYTAEARQQVGYDVGLLMNGVIIHEVDPVNRPYQSTAQVVDGDNDGDPADDGTAWTPGETFTGEGGFTLCVLGATPTGFRVAAAIGQRPNCSFAVDFSPSTLSADDLTPAAGQAISLSVNLLNYGIPADNVGVTATLPAGATYVTSTANTTQGTVLTATAAGPIVFKLGTVTGEQPVQMDYTIRVQEDVVSPTLLINTATVAWNTGAFTLTERLVANAEAAAAVEMSAKPPVIVADGQSSTQIRIVVKDAKGQLLLMPDDLLTVTSDHGMIDSPVIIGAGTATSVLTSTTSAGAATVVATAGSISAMLQVPFVAGPAASIRLRAKPEALQPGENSESVITAIVTDAYSNPVTNQTVTFNSTLGTITGSAITGANGIATAVLNVPNKEGAAIVSATTGNISASLTVRIAQKPYNVFLPTINR